MWRHVVLAADVLTGQSLGQSLRALWVDSQGQALRADLWARLSGQDSLGKALWARLSGQGSPASLWASLSGQGSLGQALGKPLWARLSGPASPASLWARLSRQTLRADLWAVLSGQALWTDSQGQALRAGSGLWPGSLSRLSGQALWAGSSSQLSVTTHNAGIKTAQNVSGVTLTAVDQHLPK